MRNINCVFWEDGSPLPDCRYRDAVRFLAGTSEDKVIARRILCDAGVNVDLAFKAGELDRLPSGAALVTDENSYPNCLIGMTEEEQIRRGLEIRLAERKSCDRCAATRSRVEGLVKTWSDLYPSKGDC